jgi:hypothetical protein
VHADRPEPDDAAAELLGIARRIERTVRDDDLRRARLPIGRLGRADLEASGGEHCHRADREPVFRIRPEAQRAFDVDARDRARRSRRRR